MIQCRILKGPIDQKAHHTLEVNWVPQSDTGQTDVLPQFDTVGHSSRILGREAPWLFLGLSGAPVYRLYRVYLYYDGSVAMSVGEVSDKVHRDMGLQALGYREQFQ